MIVSNNLVFLSAVSVGISALNSTSSDFGYLNDKHKNHRFSHENYVS